MHSRVQPGSHCKQSGVGARQQQPPWSSWRQEIGLCVEEEGNRRNVVFRVGKGRTRFGEGGGRSESNGTHHYALLKNPNPFSLLEHLPPK